MLSFLYVYSDHSILECYNLFSGVELSMRSFFVIIAVMAETKKMVQVLLDFKANWRDHSYFRDLTRVIKDD